MLDRKRFALISREADAVGTPLAKKDLAKTLTESLADFAGRVARGEDGAKAARAIAKATQKDLDALNKGHVTAFAARGFELAGAFLGRKQFAGVSPKVRKRVGIGTDQDILSSKFLKVQIADWLTATSSVENSTTAAAYERLWRNMVQEGITDGPTLGKAIMELGLAQTQTRAELMARTMSIYGYNAGAADQYRDAGLEEKEWLVTEDDALCDICRPFDGKVVKIGGVFETASNDSMGLGIQNPPLHPNCRCCLLPVL